MMLSYEAAFGIGLIASVSTCLAVVGGLVLSLSVSAAKKSRSWRTQTLFHLGRLGGFFLFGGLIGLIGGSFRPSFFAQQMLTLAVALTMLVLGLSLLDLFPKVKKFQLKMPERMRPYIMRWGTYEHSLAPLLLGAGTFFLPCGFTQSVQLAALAAGSFTEGSLTMLSFALGTLPVLALISLGSFNIAQQAWRKTFFRIAGAGISATALFSIIHVFHVMGVLAPRVEQQEMPSVAVSIDGVQVIDITAKAGYSPRIITAKAGIPTVLRMRTNDTYDCSASVVIPKLSYQRLLSSSEVVEIPVSADEAQGTLQGLCAMGMYNFQIQFR